MGFLEAERIKRDGKPVDSICQHVPKNILRFGYLGEININRPDRVTTITSKLHKEQLAPNKPTIIVGILFPEVGLFLNLSWNLYVRRVICCEDILKHHRQPIACKHLALFSNTSQIQLSTISPFLGFNTLINTSQVSLKQILSKDFA